MMTTREHEWIRTRFTGVTICDRCGLLPLDPADRDTPCEPEPPLCPECGASVRVALSGMSASCTECWWNGWIEEVVTG